MKIVGLWVFLLLTFGLLVRAAGGDGKDSVPVDYQNRFLKIHTDQLTIANRDLQMTAQLDADRQTLQHDSQELERVKQECLKAANRDPNVTDIDYDKMIFVVKPPTPAPPPGK